jgi:hypothetical protein
METEFPLRQSRCYQQAARLMHKGASLSVALRGCMGTRGSRNSAVNSTPGPHHPTDVLKKVD